MQSSNIVPTWPRRLRVAGALALLLTLLWSAAWFFVPPLISSQAQKMVTQKLGRALALGRVTFNPWTLEVTVEDLAIAGAQANSLPLLNIKRLYANAAISSLWRLAPVIDSLEVDQPALRLTHLGEGRYDIDDVLQRVAAAPSSADGRDPPRFAIHNIVVRGGAADLEDRPLWVVHRVRDLQIGIPFLSTLPSERQVTVAPHLSWVLDGNRFASAAAATPWSEAGNGEARLQFDRVDLAPYFGYLPDTLTARPQTARLSADLHFAFEQRPKLALRISGTVQADSVKLVNPAAQPLLEVSSVKAAIDDLRPFENLARLSRIEIDTPHVLATRGGTTGGVALGLRLEPAKGSGTPASDNPRTTTATVSSASSASALGSSSHWKATVAALSVRAGQLDWRDLSTMPPAELSVGDFSLDARAIHWPADAPLVFKGGGTLGTSKGHGRITFSGQGNASGGTGRAEVVALPLVVARAYLRDVLEPAVAGDLSAEFGLDWVASPNGAQLKVDASRITLATVVLGEARSSELGAEAVELTDVRADTAARIASVGKFVMRAPRLRMERDAGREWNFTRWMRKDRRAKDESAVAAATRPAASASAGAPAWKATVGDFVVERGRVQFAERSLAEPVELDIYDLSAQAGSWALDSTSITPFRLAARVSSPAGPPNTAVRNSRTAGSLDVKGEMKGLVNGVPSAIKAKLLVKDLPLHLLEPYVHSMLDIDVERAQASFKGEAAWDRRTNGSSLHLRGDSTIDDVRVTSRAGDLAASRISTAAALGESSEHELLNWKSLSLRGIDVALAPDAAPRIAVADTVLSDFFARLVLDESGSLNLQHVTRSAKTETPAAPNSAGAGAMAASVSSSSVQPPVAGTAILDFGPITVVNGRVNYNDRFVKPNYTANISELNGKLTAFSSRPASPGTPPQLAELELHGRVEGTASLDIAGQLNPLVRPLALDLKAKVRDLELPPLSPYAIKYSGYGIERGKMSVDLAYVVKPDGQLTASNKIILNQLAFGNKVEGSTASLPVKLAVALLADRHGVIDLDLPVSGSINDPKFSLGGLIWKVITNLVVKAVTAPFSLLGSAFSGGSENSEVDFAPGTAALTDAAKERLDKVAKALVDRPALTLTVSGEARLDVEREGWKRDRLQQMLRSEKRRQAIADGANASAEVTVSEGEYAALLQQVYKRADVVKPRNVVGLAKDLPASEMEALLLASISIPDDAMQQLAVSRAVVVRDYLATKDLPTSRLFIGAAKTAPAEDTKWAPRAELKLAAQ